MEVVINVCFGGFGISPKALKKLIDMKSDAIEIMPIHKYSSSKTFEDMKSKYSFGDRYVEYEDGFIWDGHIVTFYKDEMVYSLKDKYKCKSRAHPDLIKVVKELGKEANGQCAKLKIVEIPDGINWIIDEYDGTESIQEEHRSWC